MAFSLFGSKIKQQEKSLRKALSKDKFLIEFEKTLEVFHIEPTLRPGKSKKYCEVEAASRFVLEEAMKQAAKKKLLKSATDLEAAATFGVAAVEFLGRYWGVDETDRKAMQGSVPGHVFPKVSKKLLGEKSAETIGKSVSRGVVRYTRNIGKKKFRRMVDDIENDLTQFVSHRDSLYLDTFARHLKGLS